MNPKVSIIIPVYNGSNFVAEAIESALAQTYRNLEIIVVNDGSTDGGATDEAVKPYLDRIVYIPKKNGGVSSALNTGIKAMTGEYFSWLSHDDLYAPDKVEKQVALIKTPDDIILCSGNLIDKKGEHIRHRIITKEGRFTGLELYKLNIDGYSLNGLGFLIPKHVFDRVGYFDETMRYLQDYDEWLRMMFHKEYVFVCHRDLLVSSRIHLGQQTNTISHLFDTDRTKMVKKHADMIMSDDSISDKNGWIEAFFLGCTQSQNETGVKIMRDLLLKSGYSKFKLMRLQMPYLVKGLVMSIGRKVLNSIRSLKGERN
ncbi:MAG: glycosyltransferase [Muribaculaceae bacterium]|nr:glycosyltransferase [Muribaculaceae bacterium]